MTTPTSRPRRRGAQPGNINARKHGFYASKPGFYSSKLPRSDRAALDNTEFSGLAEEISLLRAYIRRVVSLAPPPEDYSANLESLRVLCHATTALSRLVRTHALLGIASSEIERAREQALKEIAEELWPDTSSADPSPEGIDDFAAQSDYNDSPSAGETQPSLEPFQPP